MLLESANLQKGKEISQPVGWRRAHKVIQPPVYVYNIQLQRCEHDYWPPTSSDVFEVVCDYGRKNSKTKRYAHIVKWVSYERAVTVFYEKIEEMREKG